MCLGIFCPLEHGLQKEALVGGQSLSSPKQVQKSVAMLDEGRREPFGCFSNREAARMQSIGAGAMNEKDSGSRSRSGRSPEVAFEAQIATRNHNDLRSD